MRRLRAFTYSVVVALTVFIYLSLPTLRGLYGPVANIPVYALAALVAGRLTWLLLVDRSGAKEPGTEANLQSGVEGTGDGEEDVEDELASLKEDL